jgi:hypothetical protein
MSAMSWAGETTAPVFRPHMQPLAEIEPAPVDWVWPRYLNAGTVTTLRSRQGFRGFVGFGGAKGQFQSCKVSRAHGSNAISKGWCGCDGGIVVFEYRGHKRPIGRRAPRFPCWQCWRPLAAFTKFVTLREAAASSR